MDEKRIPDEVVRPSSRVSNKTDRGAIIFFTCCALLICALAYLIIFVAIPADRATRLEKERVAQAAIRGPEVFAEMLEEMKKLRIAVERIAERTL